MKKEKAALMPPMCISKIPYHLMRRETVKLNNNWKEEHLIGIISRRLHLLK
jgi:hypothetical protein